MTVISTIITKRFTAHASDSLLTPFGKHDKAKRETQNTKIIPVRHWRGAMSYWGLANANLANTNKDWDTLDWLRERARNAHHFDSPQEFAQALRRDLNQEFRNMRFPEPRQAGLGIHLSVYERVNDYSIPEMFKISNWVDNHYNAVFPDGFQLGRVTYHTSLPEPIDERPEDGEPDRRLELHQKLQDGMMLIYN